MSHEDRDLSEVRRQEEAIGRNGASPGGAISGPTVEHRLRVSGDVEMGHDEDGQPWMQVSAFTLLCLSDGSVRWER